ncbi:MAG: YggT family protein [Christensenellaceae bacterium]|nr:YggT family protein [Christensenellaceae bacterium]
MRLYLLLHSLLELYKLVLLAYVVLSWLRIPSNRWTVLLQRLVEPVVTPVRTFLRARLPREWQMFDWSVLVVYLLIGVVEMLLRMVLGTLLW